MKRTVLTGMVAACLGLAVFVGTAPGASAHQGAPVPVPTSRATADARPTHRASVHVSVGVSLPTHHRRIVPPEIRGGTVYLPDVSAGPIILPTVKGGTITLPDVKGGTITLPDVKGGTITLPDVSGRPIVLPKIEGGTVSIPPIVFPSMHAMGSLRVNGTVRGQVNGKGHGNFLAAGGVGAPVSRPVALPRTGA
ncbi:hypothetical protein [Cutibacterium avidum]|uniref:hypothetical protein n=1 Tax=Cutibacterium avidum TaxID=33010 RepID=UPI003B00FABE